MSRADPMNSLTALSLPLILFFIKQLGDNRLTSPEVGIDSYRERRHVNLRQPLLATGGLVAPPISVKV